MHSFKDDVIHVRGDYSIVQHKVGIDISAMFNRTIAEQHHRDFIQLIPKGRTWSQFALGSLTDVLIADNFCYSTGKLQGIFASDGLFYELQIINNTIVTNSDHLITINGVISGVFIGNNSPLLAMPARIGGRPEGFNNVWVNSFKKNDYQKLQGDVIDRRRDHIHDDDIHLNNFDLDGFYKTVSGLILPNSVNKYCATLQQVALDHGEI